MEIKEIQYENYGKCVQISNGIIDAVVTIDSGPRIVRFGFAGSENVLYNDLEQRYTVHNDAMKEMYGEDAVFYYYGGHRVQLTPRAFYPDNSPAVYGILPDGVSFTPPKQKQNEIQLGFEVVMGEDAADIMIVHTAKNCSKEAQVHGLRAATMINGGGTVIIPQNTDSHDSLLPNRMIALWSGTDIRDPRIFYGNRFITICHSQEDNIPLKLGINNIFGWAGYVGKHYTLVKRYVHKQQAAYPDFGCSFEAGLNKDYAELASLSPMYRMEPGEGIRHVENFSLFKTNNSIDPADEDQIARYIENLELVPK